MNWVSQQFSAGRVAEVDSSGRTMRVVTPDLSEITGEYDAHSQKDNFRMGLKMDADGAHGGDLIVEPAFEDLGGNAGDGLGFGLQEDEIVGNIDAEIKNALIHFQSASQIETASEGADLVDVRGRIDEESVDDPTGLKIRKNLPSRLAGLRGREKTVFGVEADGEGMFARRTAGGIARGGGVAELDFRGDIIRDGVSEGEAEGGFVIVSEFEVCVDIGIVGEFHEA